MNTVKSSSSNDGSQRQSERLRNERDVLRGYVDFFESLKKAFQSYAKENPKRMDALALISSLLSRQAPALGDQPGLAFMLDATSAFIEGLQESSVLSNQLFDQAIPSYLDGFLTVEYAEAKNVLHQFDRAAKALSESEQKLLQLKAQPKPDLGVISQQETSVQHCAADFDRAEEQAYDVLFRVNEDANLVLVRCMSQFLRAWADYLSGAAGCLATACEALQAEKATTSELAELSIPQVNVNLSGAAASHQPSRLSINMGSTAPPPPIHRPAAPESAPSEPSPAQSPYVALKAKGVAPQKAKMAKNPSGAALMNREVPPPPLLGKAPVQSTAAVSPTPGFLDGEAALDALMAHEVRSSPAGGESSSSSFLRPATPQPLSSLPAASAVAVSSGRPQSGVFEAADGSMRKGRQRVERESTFNPDSTLPTNEPNDFTSNVYKQLAPAEAPRKAVSSRTFPVRSGKRMNVQLLVDVDRMCISISEPMVPTYEYSMTDLAQCYKAAKHGTRLVLRAHGKAKEKYEFVSVDEREMCWELIWALRGIPLQNNLTVFTTSFNLGEMRGPENLEHWLPEGYDVYAVGVQECEYIPHRQYDSVEADLFDGIQRHLGKDYIKVAGLSLLSIRLIVLVRRKYMSNCTNVKMRKVPCGHLGKVGNKGAVAIAFQVLNTRICFITAHLAAHDEKYAERNQDMQNIWAGLRSLVPAGMSPLNYYHALFVFGDFNYRVELPRDTVLTSIERGDAATLLSRDQLQRAITEGSAFYGFSEGSISFSPTYRMLRGRDGYSDEKMRVPSWTDRVLWRALPAVDVKLGAYSSCPAVMTSDHRPVFAAFQIPLFKPNLPHAAIKCSILLTQLHGEVSTPRPTSVAVFSSNLLDPAFPPESLQSYNSQWGDISTIYPFVTNPSYVSARHLMLTVRVDRRDIIGTGSIPLAPACGVAQAFKIFLHDEKGLYAGTLSGVVAVNFALGKE